MQERDKVSWAVVRRLPGYYRHLEALERDGVSRISSQALAVRMGLTASQIRQDINCFGTLGQQGYGYNVTELRRHIGQILGVDRGYRAVVVGAGNIGRAVSSYYGPEHTFLTVLALFDPDTALHGQKGDEAPILPLDQLSGFLREHKIDVGIIATPAQAAQESAIRLMEGGVRALWNFAPVDVETREGCAIQNVHLTDSLMVLTYHMAKD
jgi:redox-sensing transcriptional repressor